MPRVHAQAPASSAPCHCPPGAVGNVIRYALPVLAAALCFIALSAPSAAGATPPPFGEFAAKLKSRIVAAQTANRMVCRGELVCGIAELPGFYARRNYQPAWITTDGGSALADELVECIEASRHDGLSPQHYHLGSIRRLLQLARQPAETGRPPDADASADLEFLLTDAFLTLGSHLRAGRVNPVTFEEEWVTQIEPVGDLGRILERAIESRRIAETLESLRPPHPEYTALREALKRCRDGRDAVDWPRLPDKTSWERGQGGDIADRLRERLRLSGDLPQNPGEAGADPDLELHEGLRRFQARHGLEIDGRMGAQTLQALNVPLSGRTRQIELNLERWRWLPRELGARHIRVNVPQFDLAVIEGREEVLRMRVVVGRHYRRTPVFSGLMDHVVFNPDWSIPTRIAVEDILPKARKDPGYIAREKIRVFESWGAGAAELNPVDIDWSMLAPGNFGYKLKKDPGSHNDLGRLKFMFPNKFSVYLHDTPSRKLFERSMRGFSSGCIRIENPIDLAEYVLKGSPDWPRAAVAAAVDSGAHRTVRLPHRIPIHLIYMTAGVNPDGRLQFWPDIYQRDPTLDRALRSAAPPG